MPPVSIAVVILTHNEEIHIERCISSIQNLASDIVVIDSYSNDRTIEVAEKLGARVYKNTWKNYATQFQWALDNAEIKSDWIMRLDADEYLESDLDDLKAVLSACSSEVTGLIIKRKLFFMGKWIKHGAIYPIYHLRIWRNGVGRIENRWMDEHIVLRHGDTINADIDIVDDNKNPVSWWINKHNSYATREVIDILNTEYLFLPKDNVIPKGSNTQAKIKRFLKESLYNKLPIFIRPVLFFVYRYFFRLGFLDGVAGYSFHFMECLWYRSLVDLKIYELRRLINNERSPDKIKEIISKTTGINLL